MGAIITGLILFHKPQLLDSTKETLWCSDEQGTIESPNYIVFYRVLIQTRTVEIFRVEDAAQHVP